MRTQEHNGRSAIQAHCSVNELLYRFPGTAAVLARFGMDLCCGGFDTLETSARNAGVDLDELLTEIRIALEES